jgi:serine/threonine-protein kinase
MSSCFRCGANVAPEDRFCGNCGVSMSLAGQDEAILAAPSDAPHASSSAAAPAHTSSDEEETTQGGTDTGDDNTPDAPPPAPANSAQFDETIIDHPAIVFPAKEPDARPAAEASASQEQPASSGPAETPAESQTSTESAQESATPAEFAATPAENVTPPVEARPAAPSMPFASSVEPKPVEARPVERERRNTADNSHPPPAEGRTSRPEPIHTGGRRHQESKQLEPGTSLNARYEIVRRIGGGGMGAVYYAKDKNLGDAPRAVKEMIQSQLDESQHEKAVGDFKRESMLLASLEHPSIPTIYDYFYDEHANRFYLVMKYISGGDFLSRLRNAPAGRIDEQTVTDWACQVADVLDYLHNRRPPIIYRDLKPANLMIDGNSGRVMLIDFGIARWVAPQEKGVTAVGTMGYAPPELFSGKVEPRSDLYSLGATMFHLLTGSDPQDNPLLIFDFTKNPRPRQINPAISNEMERILMRSVEYKPEGRFRSAGEMRDALGGHLERLRSGLVSYGGATLERSSDKTVAVEMVFCGFCGGRIAADDVFCAHCGAKQPLANASAALRAARATAKLVVAGTTELDASFQLHKENNLVGRSDPHSNIFPEIDLSKFDPETKISRRHARIWREGDTFLVEDLGSVNGTVINDSVRLGPRQPRALENGDKLRLGETTLHFLIG